MQCPVHLVRAKTKSSWCQYALAADPQSALLLAVAVNLAGDSLRQEIVFRQCRFAEESVGEAAINNVCRGNLLLKFFFCIVTIVKSGAASKRSQSFSAVLLCQTAWLHSKRDARPLRRLALL